MYIYVYICIYIYVYIHIYTDKEQIENGAYTMEEGLYAVDDPKPPKLLVIPEDFDPKTRSAALLVRV